MNSDLFAHEDVTYENCPEMRLREVSRLLIDSGIENGNNEARQLFLKFGGLSKSDVLFGDAVSSAPELYYAIKRRLKREPFSYIVGEVGFYRESYITTPAVLVPRQDTEHLVDYGVKNIPDGGRFLDTGMIISNQSFHIGDGVQLREHIRGRDMCNVCQ